MVDHRPHVVTVVNNGMSNDARVIKTAHTLTRAGARVTALGVASAGSPRQEGGSPDRRFVRLPTFPARGLTPAYLAFAVRRRAGALASTQRWRSALPVLASYAAAFVPELRRLRPDVVHVHDIHLLAAVLDAFPPGGGDRPRILYDAHEYVAGLAVSGARTRRTVDAWGAMERALIGAVDQVVTVAPQLASRLSTEHTLRAPVAVVYNAPLRWPVAVSGRALRAEAGVDGRDVDLIVYSGAVSAARGLDTVLRALPELPERVHLAVVAVPFPHPMAGELASTAARLGVGGRLHLVPPVPSHEVPAYLAGADAAISPIMGDSASYDMALPNKLFEFIHAGLPILTSDVAAMSGFVRAHALGEVFAQGDAASCAAAVRRLLADPPRPETEDLKQEYSWQGQEAALVAAYADLVPGLHAPAEPWRVEDLLAPF